MRKPFPFSYIALSLCLLIGSAFAQDDLTTQIEQLTDTLRSLNAQKQSASTATDAYEVAMRRQKLLLKLAAQDPKAALHVAQSASNFQNLAANAKALVESDADEQGTMEVLVEDYMTTHRIRYFLQTAKEKLELHLDGTPSRRLMTGARVRARGKRVDGAMLVALNGSGTSSSSGLQLLAQTLPNTFGSQTTAVILVTFQDKTTQPMSASAVRDLVFTSVSNFDRENSQNQTWLTGDVFGYFPIAMSSTSCDTNTLASLANSAATSSGVNLSSYRHIVYMFPTISACGWAGLGSIGGNPSRAWINGTFNTLVVGHEMGHNFGLYHAHALNCNGSTLGSSCSSIEYGDPFEIMGNATASHFGAFHKEQLGWLNYGSSLPIITVTSGGTYNITPYASTVAGPKAIKVLKSTDSSGAKTWYYIEYRQPVGFDSGLTNYPSSTQGVVIRTGAESSGDSSYLLDINPSTSSFSDAALGIGKSYTDSTAGVTITVVSADANGAAVKVDLGGTTTCTAAAPGVSISPAAGQSVSAGTPVTYTATVTNRDTAQCNNSTLNLTSTVPSGWTGTLSTTSLNLAPGASGTATMQVTSPSTASSGSYNLSVTARNATSNLSASGSATYNVATTTTSSAGQLASPAPGSTLPGSTATFTWSGSGVIVYYLFVGSSIGANDIFGANSLGTSTSATVSSIPVDGRTIYVRLWSYLSSGWTYKDYTFKAATQGGGGGGGTSTAATLLTPAPGSKMTSTTQTFSWTAGTGVSQYFLYIGSWPGGSNIYGAGMGTKTSITLSGFPTGSQTFYIRLWSYITTTGWTYNDYTVTGP